VARWDPNEKLDTGFAKVLEQLVGWVAPIKDEHILLVATLEIELGPVGCEDTAALPQPPGGSSCGRAAAAT